MALFFQVSNTGSQEPFGKNFAAFLKIYIINWNGNILMLGIYTLYLGQKSVLIIQKFLNEFIIANDQVATIMLPLLFVV